MTPSTVISSVSDLLRGRMMQPDRVRQSSEASAGLWNDSWNGGERRRNGIVLLITPPMIAAYLIEYWNTIARARGQ